MRNRRVLAALFCAAALMSLTGCMAKPTGGALTEKGMKALEEGEYSAALENFNKAIQRGEDEVPAYRGLGLAQMAQAQYQEAAESFKSALSYADEKMPETVRDIELYLATAQFRGGDNGGTISTCQSLLESKPTADAAFFMGAAYLNLGDEDQARNYFDQAISLQSGDYDLYLEIYEQYEEENLTAIGDQYLQTALMIPPETMEDSVSIGRIYYYLEQYDKAKETVNSAAEEGFMPARELMGEIYLAREDYVHAQSMYETIMEEEGESGVLYNGLAQCALASGDYDKALAYIEQGIALGEDSSLQALRFNEIVAYERKLDFSTAKLKAEAYISLYPSDEAGRKEYTFLITR